jgi:hypothetical protein
MQPQMDGLDQSIKALMMEFLQSLEKVASAEQIRSFDDRGHPYGRFKILWNKKLTGLHIVASLGIPFLKVYLEGGGRVHDDLESQERTFICCC